MQTIVMTCDKSDWTLPGFSYLFDKYTAGMQNEVVVCGFRSPPLRLPDNYKFFKIGNFSDFPASKWSDSLMIVLDHIAADVFLLMLDDYWVYRQVDIKGVKILHDYVKQFGYVLKADVTAERLNNNPEQYHFNQNNYAHAGHLDLIKSKPGSSYQMSLWGGLWHRDNLKRLLVKGETAQEIELLGTGRLNSMDEKMIVIGTRQMPLLHGNIIQSGKKTPVYKDVGWEIQSQDFLFLSERGWVRYEK